MKLKVLDQIAISSVSADTLAPGREIAVSASFGKELMKLHPDKFEEVSDDEKPEAEAEKAMPAPANKAEPAAPANKAATGKKKG